MCLSSAASRHRVHQTSRCLDSRQQQPNLKINQIYFGMQVHEVLQRRGYNRVVFTASRTIERGEELTLDYAPGTTAAELRRRREQGQQGLRRCLCGTASCRGLTL